MHESLKNKMKKERLTLVDDEEVQRKKAKFGRKGIAPQARVSTDKIVKVKRSVSLNN